MQLFGEFWSLEKQRSAYLLNLENIIQRFLGGKLLECAILSSMTIPAMLKPRIKEQVLQEAIPLEPETEEHFNVVSTSL